ncbi:hypothetical protein C1701_03550 [Actinoalloteichus sp. AHMU CJ021]|nr:hypothetical protein C1701_03550 [Actinoalloteichus sp. AHMU CJ021]
MRTGQSTPTRGGAGRAVGSAPGRGRTTSGRRGREVGGRAGRDRTVAPTADGPEPVATVAPGSGGPPPCPLLDVVAGHHPDRVRAVPPPVTPHASAGDTARLRR